MKTNALVTILVLGLIASAFGQNQTLDLTFTAVDNIAYVQLDSIKVMNRTQGGELMIYWPDTTLTVDITPGDLLLYIGYMSGYPVGVQEIIEEKDQFRLFQNYPNPVQDQSIVSMYIPEEGTVNIMVTDVRGRLLNNSSWQLEKGNHSFRFTPVDGSLFFLTGQWNGINRTIKILAAGTNSGNKCTLDYIGSDYLNLHLKTSSLKAGLAMLESGILDSPAANITYTFQFATNIPCPGTPTVTYGGQVYNTIQIFSQCWLKENLNVGTMIPGTQEMSNNSVIEKYCYKNEVDSCTKFGGLYQWNEMMQYTTLQGSQGICPSGWHLPTDEEWKVLEGAVDSQYGIGDSEWNQDLEGRGFDAGTNMKSISGWKYEGNGTDLFGFSALPGGFWFDAVNLFYTLGSNGDWWTSTEGLNIGWYRDLNTSSPGVARHFTFKENGFSVRCLRDN